MKILELTNILNELENIDDSEIMKKGKLLYELFDKYGTNKICPKCGHQLLRSDLSQYKYLCYECDENFYDFEGKDIKQLQQENEKLKAIINCVFNYINEMARMGVYTSSYTAGIEDILNGEMPYDTKIFDGDKQI